MHHEPAGTLESHAGLLVEQMDALWDRTHEKALARGSCDAFSEHCRYLMACGIGNHLSFRASRLDYDRVCTEPSVAEAEMLRTNAVECRTPL
jgi:hypothetical protein